MIRIFTGFDQRESCGWHAFAQSVIERTSAPFSLSPISDSAPRDGTNAFTYARFLVPNFCGFSGWAIFVDGADMIAMADLRELWEMRDSSHAVKVVKHSYQTKFPRKYIGTEMESANADYPRKNWSSVILWNCGHRLNRQLTPEFVAEQPGSFLHRFSWLPDNAVGELPAEWNWLADEYGANTAAKLLHWTAGIPGINAYARSPHAQAWFYNAARSREGPVQKRVAEVASHR